MSVPALIRLAAPARNVGGRRGRGRFKGDGPLRLQEDQSRDKSDRYHHGVFILIICFLFILNKSKYMRH